MSCWVCNPFCGRCKKPMAKPVKCNVCGKHNLPNPQNKCQKCGAQLPETDVSVIKAPASPADISAEVDKL